MQVSLFATRSCQFENQNSGFAPSVLNYAAQKFCMSRCGEQRHRERGDNDVEQIGVTILITLKEGCSQLGSGGCRMFYSCISFFFRPSSDFFGTDHYLPLPLRGLRPRMHCIDGSNHYCPLRCIVDCTHFCFFTFCIVDVPCDFFSTKETGHRALSAHCSKICSVSHYYVSSLRIPPCHILSTHFLLCSIESRRASW